MAEEEILPCTEKMSFDTKAQAEGVALATDWQYGNKLKAYQCQYCQLWHLATRYRNMVDE